MLPTIIYVIDAIRRALEKTGRGVSIVIQAFYEAQKFRHATRSKYPGMWE
jgi:hypothetical protein